jgi:hypothetical protein
VHVFACADNGGEKRNVLIVSVLLLTLCFRYFLLLFVFVDGVCVYYCSTYYKVVRLGGEGNNGGHVLRETTSRSLCGLVCPSRTSERRCECVCVCVLVCVCVCVTVLEKKN